MSIRVLLGVVLIGAFAAVFPAAAQDGDDAGVRLSPKIEFETTEFEFGEIYDDQQQSVNFKFTNTGNGTLVIRELQASCQCTAGTLEKRSYEPGESGEITVIFNPKNKRGQQRQYVRVYCNDPDTPQTTLNATGRVRPRIYVDPKLLSFGGMRSAGETKTLTFTVSGRGEGFKVTEAFMRKNNDAFKIEIFGPKQMRLDNEDVQMYELHVTLDGKLPIGVHSDSVAFKTNDPDAPERTINLSARINGQLQATPQTLKIGRARVGQTYKGSFVVSNRDGKPFKITDVNVDSLHGPAAETEIVAIDESSYKVSLRGMPVKGDRFAQGTVMVQTDIEGEPPARVKYHAIVLRK